MCLLDAKTSLLLTFIDLELANEAQVVGCPRCGGKLHRADFPRKARGVAAMIAIEFFSKRFSLCCAVEGCRARFTPRSVRYLGRRLFPGWIALLIAFMAEGRNQKECIPLLEKLFGVSGRSVERWRGQWQAFFATSNFWKEWKGHLLAAMDIQKPSLGALLQAFGTNAAVINPEALVRFLKFLSPLSLAPD